MPLDVPNTAILITWIDNIQYQHLFHNPVSRSFDSIHCTRDDLHISESGPNFTWAGVRVNARELASAGAMTDVVPLTMFWSLAGIGLPDALFRKAEMAYKTKEKESSCSLAYFLCNSTMYNLSL